MKLTTRQLHRTAAFTLLELLVGAVMFAIVVATVSTVLHGAMQLQRRTHEMLVHDRQLDMALDTFRRDFRSAAYPGGTLATNLTTLLQIGSSQGSRVEFYSYSGLTHSNSPYGDLEKVTYFLQEPGGWDQTNGLDLVRGSYRNLTSFADQDYSEWRLLQGIDQMTLEFWDGTTWQTAWDSVSMDPPQPTAVRMTLQMVPTREYPQGVLHQISVPLSIQGPTNGTNQASTTLTTGGTQ